MLVRLMALAIAVTSPVSSFAAPAAPPQPPTAAADPNEKICETISVIGSRLAKKRICATRAEWADRRLQDRKDGEAIQRQMNGSTCVPVKTNGIAIC